MKEIPPTLIHLNGTSRADLLDLQRKAVDALRTAIGAVADAAPHGRDYYPLGPEAYMETRKAHAEVLTAVCDAYDTMMAFAIDTDAQKPRKDVA